MSEPTHGRVAAPTFLCPGCDETEFPDEIGVVTCECGAHIETLEPLGMRRILRDYWTRYAAPSRPPSHRPRNRRD